MAPPPGMITTLTASDGSTARTELNASSCKRHVQAASRRVAEHLGTLSQSAKAKVSKKKKNPLKKKSTMSLILIRRFPAARAVATTQPVKCRRRRRRLPRPLLVPQLLRCQQQSRRQE